MRFDQQSLVDCISPKAPVKNPGMNHLRLDG
jgi:hypothetical protein